MESSGKWQERHLKPGVSNKVDGPITAAILSSGIGCLVIGLMTTGAVVNETLKNFLNWWNPAGPLTGKTGIGIIAWLITWAIFHLLLKERETELRKTMMITLTLLAIGLVLTFPPVFEAFE